VDADIKGAFDNIDHDYLLATIGNFPARELVKQWLKAGVVDAGVFNPTETGTPQGGVISPLLANIALHGMEETVGMRFNKQGESTGKRAVVRYADDFVVFCESQEDAEYVRQHVLPAWLAKRGLTLSPEKTKVVHLTDGFDFLGFTIRHYRVAAQRTGYKLLITPSKERMNAIRKQLRDEWHTLIGQPLDVVMKRLNPVIRGQANYFRHVVAKRSFNKLDHYMWQKARRWARRTHPNKSTKWRTERYWGQLNKQRKDRWVFGNKDSGSYLQRYSWVKIERHVMTKGTASKDDPQLRSYFAERSKRAMDLMPRERANIGRRTNGVCLVCHQPFGNDEEVQVHHVLPRSQGGADSIANKALLHLYCHQQITGREDEYARLLRDYERLKFVTAETGRTLTPSEAAREAYGYDDMVNGRITDRSTPV